MAEQWSTRECRHDCGDDSGGRYEDEINFGMTEEPEEMLPQQDITTFSLIEEVRAHEAVEDEHGARHHDGGHREQDHEGRHQRGPDEHRNAVERHTGTAHLEDRDDDL